MKGVITMGWKLLLAVIAGLILLVIAFLVFSGLIKACSITQGLREACLLLISKLQFLGVGSGALQICEVFEECPQA